jgi:hypothetical protein
MVINHQRPASSVEWNTVYPVSVDPHVFAIPDLVLKNWGDKLLSTIRESGGRRREVGSRWWSMKTVRPRKATSSDVGEIIVVYPISGEMERNEY